MIEILKSAIAAIGIDIGKNSFHVVGLVSRRLVPERQFVGHSRPCSIAPLTILGISSRGINAPRPTGRRGGCMACGAGRAWRGLRAAPPRVPRLVRRRRASLRAEELLAEDGEGFLGEGDG